MRPDDSNLLAYVDGELEPAESASIEEELAGSPALRESVALLRASNLPYREAFGTQKLPPVPEDLQRRIEAMADAAQPRLLSTHSRGSARRRPAPLWLAAAFVAGAFFTGFLLRFGPAMPPAPGNAGTMIAQGETAPWIRSAADYQALYSRDTLADVTPDLAGSAKTVDAIQHVDGLALRVPDLHDTGLTFKTIARLRFRNKPLIQILYLPQRGAPVALCVVKDARADQQIDQQQLTGMTVVSWRQNELAYALIGQTDTLDLKAIARQISTRRVDAIFARIASREQPLS
jgi:anti-sigma factor RsiW